MGDPVVIPVGRRLALPSTLVSVIGTALLSACVPAHRHPSWAIYPLQRVAPHDALAVVSQPDGYGLHIWLDTDTRQIGRCKPRWSVDAARLSSQSGRA